MDPRAVTLILTPHGRLLVTSDADAPPLTPDLHEPLLRAFDRGSGHGLLLLGADAVGALFRRLSAWWRDFGGRYVTAVCTQSTETPDDLELEQMVFAAPPMIGGEYLTAPVLRSLWHDLDAAFTLELAESQSLAEPQSDVQQFLKRRNPAWNLVGRVHFNLAENRKDPEAPFAFLATYTTRLSAQAKAQHLPLGQALREYAGAANKDRLLALLLPVQRASETCPWLKDMVDAGEIFHPLRWTPAEALQLLRDVPGLEAAGVVRANAGRMARQSSTAAPGNGRRGTASRPSGTGPGGAARLQHGSHAGRRSPDRRRNQRAARKIRGTCTCARPLGRGRSRTAAAHDRPLP